MRQLSDLESYITGEAPTKFKPDFEDNYEFMNEPQVLPTQGNTVQSGQQSTINIYAGTGENADLSNFAERPFVFQGYNFRSVEQAFQYAKLQGLKQQLIFAGSASSKRAAEKVDELMRQIMESDSGSQARAIGKTKVNSRNIDTKDTIDFYFNSIWEKRSVTAMKMLLKSSFEQNPQALQRLLATGNATLTHIQDKGKWGTEFPRLLMEVRDELRQQNDNSDNYNSNEYGDGEEMNHCK